VLFVSWLAAVFAGILVGNRGPKDALSDVTQRPLFGFWTLVDEILNSILSMLIGLEVAVLRLRPGVASGFAPCDPGCRRRALRRHCICRCDSQASV